MREWPSLVLNKRPVGDGCTTMDNVDHQSAGELNRRRGLGDYLATTPTFNRLKPYHTGPLVTLNAASGGAGVTVVNYSGAAGSVTVSYNALTIPDLFEILDSGGTVIATTTTPVSGTGTITATVTGDFSVRVTGPDGTAWSFTVSYYSSRGVIGVQTGALSAVAPKVSIIGCGNGVIYNFADLASAAMGGSLATTASAAYWSDGINPMRAFYQQTSVDAGITAPVSAPGTSVQSGGSVTAGTHLVRYRYYDSARRRYSDPSPIAEVAILDQVTATAYALVGGGQLSSIVLVNAGKGYTGNQSATIGGPGTGAAATAWISTSRSDGALVSSQVTNAGSGYTTAPAVTFPAPPTPGKTIRVPVVALGNSTVDKIIVEVTLADGSEFYQAAVVSNLTANVDVTMNDDTLAVQVAAVDYTEDGYGHAVPPKGTIAGVHGNRMFVWGATTEAADTLYWSRLGFVESFKPAEWSRRVFGSTPDTPRAMFSLSDDLYLVGARSMHRLVYTSDPGVGLLIPLPTTNGAWNQQSVVEAEGAYFGFGPSGVWVVDSLQPREISQRIREFFADQIDTSRSSEIYAWWDPIPRTVAFTFPDLTGVWRSMVYWLDEDRWSTESYKQRPSAATACEWIDGIVEPMVAGQACVYRKNNTTADGGGTPGSGTVQSYVGTTLTVNAAHSQSPRVWLYFPRTDQWGEVTACPSSASFTVDGLSGLLAGDEVQYGPIPYQIVSEWVPRDKLDRGRAVYLRIESAKTEALGILQVRLYTDWSSTPITFTSDALQTAPLGVTYDVPNSRMLVDLGLANGMTRVPVPSDWNRVIRYDIRLLTATGGIHLMDAEFEVKSKGGAE